MIDLTARDVPELLRQARRAQASTPGGDHARDVGRRIITSEPDWRTRFLATITDPSVALILLMIGVYGLFFEFWNPGFVLPGVVGAICLLIGLFALQMLPVNYAGLALILLGIGVLIAEVFLPTFGSLGVGGIVAFVIGAVMLIDTDVPGIRHSGWRRGGDRHRDCAVLFSVSALALQARRRPVVTGQEALIGSVGVALDDKATTTAGRASTASSGVCAAPIRKRFRARARVRVTARHGLTLTVEPLNGERQ